MKKILIVCDCQFSRLTLKNFYEVLLYDAIYFVTIESLMTRSVHQTNVLIHLTDNNFSKAILFIKHKVGCGHGLKNVIFFAHKDIINFMRCLHLMDLRFIDERSNAEVFLKSIAGELNFSVDEKNGLLTPAEFYVLRMMVAGLNLETIALNTKRSIKTIYSHKVNALNKLNLDNTPNSFVKLAKCFLFLPQSSL